MTCASNKLLKNMSLFAYLLFFLTLLNPFVFYCLYNSCTLHWPK